MGQAIAYVKSRLNRIPKGFTLLELLIVVAIIGVLVAVSSLSLKTKDSVNLSLSNTANLLRSRLLYARQIASVLNKTLGLKMDRAGYEFVEYDEHNHWRSVSESALKHQDWPKNILIEFSRDNEPSFLLDDYLPEVPQIMIFSNGELSYFNLYLNKTYLISNTETHDVELKML